LGILKIGEKILKVFSKFFEGKFGEKIWRGIFWGKFSETLGEKIWRLPRPDDGAKNLVENLLKFCERFLELGKF